MYRIALKMLIGDRAKFLGMIISLSLSATIITQQMAIFLGLMRRTYSLITDVNQADIWVMNTNVKMIDDINPIRKVDLLRLRSLEGVAWAMPFYKGLIRVRLPNGQLQICNLYGIDAATLIGGPHTMIEGSIENLRRPFTIIVDKVSAEDKLAQISPVGSKKPLQIGDMIEMNDRRATVVGICAVTRTFRSEPIIFTTFDRALFYTPFEQKQLSYVLVKAKENVSPDALCAHIQKTTKLKAYTNKQCAQVTFDYYMQHTGIPINFGLAVLLGLLVGAAVTGQIFFNFITDNLKFFTLFNIVGASRYLLAKMTILQALYVAFIGWGIGSGIAAIIGFLTRTTELAFYLPWWLFLGTALLMISICITTALICIRRIFNIQLWMIFK